MIQLTIKDEKQILRKQSSQKQISYSVSYDKEEVKRGEEHIKETSLEPSQNLPKYEYISHTQAREIQCVKCLGKGHLASQCSNERSMILRDKDGNSSQEKETSESEENVKIEIKNKEKVLMDQTEVWEEKFENKFENILLFEQPSDLLSCKGILACTATLAEICELPPLEKKFLK